jgi:hypothetical protein
MSTGANSNETRLEGLTIVKYSSYLSPFHIPRVNVYRIQYYLNADFGG